MKKYFKSFYLVIGRGKTLDGCVMNDKNYGFFTTFLMQTVNMTQVRPQYVTQVGLVVTTLRSHSHLPEYQVLMILLFFS